MTVGIPQQGFKLQTSAPELLNGHFDCRLQPVICNL